MKHNPFTLAKCTRLFFTVALATGFTGGVVPIGMAHAGSLSPVIDQSLTSPNNLGADINECCKFVAQTFTAGLTGVLAGINIDVSSFINSPFPLHVAIRTVTESGEPSPTILGESTLNSSSAPLSLFITFPQPIHITAGVKYAIVVNYEGAPPVGPGQFQGIWSGAAGDFYPAGNMYASFSDGISWLDFADGDLHFQTYLMPVVKSLIDIKPGDFSNHINVKSNGRIPVAILTTGAADNTATFNAATVDPATVRFGLTGTEATPVHIALEDVDGDGDVDLILHFNTQEIGVKCGEASATLTAKTFEGKTVQGTDSIKTLGCSK
ncbi:MAG: hypothetical protein V4568_14105 [Pseudomonadota bacterium]